MTVLTKCKIFSIQKTTLVLCDKLQLITSEDQMSQQNVLLQCFFLELMLDQWASKKENDKFSRSEKKFAPRRSRKKKAKKGKRKVRFGGKASFCHWAR